MCLILFAWQAHPRYPLVVAANRDEFHDRPTAAAGFWKESPGILAGCDLQAGGTWLGVSRSGRFAAVSNYREPLLRPSPLDHSRGHLVRDFLLDDSPPASHAERLQTRGGNYRGFNLLLGNPQELFYVSNRSQGPVEVSAGIHGLSNHLLDTDWPKVHSGRFRLETLLKDEYVDPETMFDLLADPAASSSTALPAEMLISEPEELTKRMFILSPVYGTRSSTVVFADHNGEVSFAERQFNPAGHPINTTYFNFRTN